MRTVTTVPELREALEPPPGGALEAPPGGRRAGSAIGLVPTMGAFHEGHLSLFRRARADCGVVVVSLFVNPSQFGEGEDLKSYPRDLARDRSLAEAESVDVLFVPDFDVVYPRGFATTVEVAGLGETLCGDPARRGPGHFRGVATVVAKLLNMCRPDVAYFGGKDFQQAMIIRRLARDLDMPVRIEVCPTVRDADGLALSSRNAYLSVDDRERALSLQRALQAAERAAADDGATPASVAAAARRELDQPGIELEYVEVVSAQDLSPLDALGYEPALVAVAARVGPARLIDNTILSASKPRQVEPAERGANPGATQEVTQGDPQEVTQEGSR